MGIKLKNYSPFVQFLSKIAKENSDFCLKFVKLQKMKKEEV